MERGGEGVLLSVAGIVLQDAETVPGAVAEPSQQRDQ